MQVWLFFCALLRFLFYARVSGFPAARRLLLRPFLQIPINATLALVLWLCLAGGACFLTRHAAQMVFLAALDVLGLAALRNDLRFFRFGPHFRKD